MDIKKLLKKIRKGDRDSLLALIDYALDEYLTNEKIESFKFNSECHAMRIAMAIHAHAKAVGEPSKDQIDVKILDIDETAEVIKQYLENEI